MFRAIPGRDQRPAHRKSLNEWERKLEIRARIIKVLGSRCHNEKLAKDI